MAIYYDAPVSPVDQTEFIRRVPTPSNLVLSQMFPSVVSDTTKVNFREITKKNRTARFRSADGRIHVADRDGATDKVVNMLPLSDSRNQGEYETLQIEMTRLGGTRTEALVDAIYNDSADLTRYVQNRVELALGDVLTDGVFAPNLHDEFTDVRIDFGVPAEHKITLSSQWAGTPGDTADGLADLRAACDLYEATNGERPGFAMTSRRNIRALETQASLINAIYGAQTGRTHAALSDAYGRFASDGIPTDWRTNETHLDVDGKNTRVIPDDVVILGPANFSDLLEFRYGLTATAMELVDSNQTDFTFSQAPGITGVVVKEGPPLRKFTFVDAIGIPLLKDAKKLMVLKVRS